MKHLLTLIAASAAALVVAAETSLAPAQTADWKKINGIGSMTMEELNGEKLFAVSGPANYCSVKAFAIDPAKTYKISGEFIAKAGTKPANIYFGFIPLNSKNRHIYSEWIFPVKGSDTELAADAKKGDTVLKVKDCSKWTPKGGFVAMKTKEDYSDLPNTNITANIVSKTKDGDIYTVTLKQPLRANFAKGTKIRQHRSSGTYQYSAASGAKLNNSKWRTFSAVIAGEANKDEGPASKKWWYTTRNVKILILCNFYGNKDSVMYFRNIKLEEVPR